MMPLFAATLRLLTGFALLPLFGGWDVAVLLVLGIALLLMEVLVLPGFGVAGVLGLVALGASIALALLGGIPNAADFVIAIHVVGASAVVLGYVGWQLFRRLAGDLGQKAMLRGDVDADGRQRRALAPPESLEVDGVALTDLRPAGTGRFGEQSADVVSEGPWIPAGTPIRVVRVEGHWSVVRPTEL